MKANYNDVPMWDYGGLFKAFAPGINVKTFKAHTGTELDAILADSDFQSATYPQVSLSSFVIITT